MKRTSGFGNFKRPIEEPVVTQEPRAGGDLVDVARHPAYAQIGASRVSGANESLYGSDFAHNAFMTVRIKLSEVQRNLSADWHSAGETMIEVALSEAQWATFVSAPNVNDGVPCTLQYVRDRGYIPGLPPPVTRAEQFSGEMRKTLAKVEQRIQDVIDKIDALNLPKKKAEELKMDLGVAKSHLGANVKYVVESFDEHAEETVEKAKQEVHGYMTGVLMRAGLTQLQGTVMPLQIEDRSDAD